MFCARSHRYCLSRGKDGKAYNINKSEMVCKTKSQKPIRSRFAGWLSSLTDVLSHFALHLSSSVCVISTLPSSNQANHQSTPTILCPLVFVITLLTILKLNINCDTNKFLATSITSPKSVESTQLPWWYGWLVWFRVLSSGVAVSYLLFFYK